MWTTLTGTGGLVVMDGRLLMVRQRRPYGVFWEMPSGFHEPGESLEQTTAREVLEETGVATAFVDPVTLADVHPLEEVVLERWWIGGETSFHVHADVLVRPDDTQDYRFRS
jgi:ADP-ribose pyrophosphatase YjhB (NUDIX family)